MTTKKKPTDIVNAGIPFDDPDPEVPKGGIIAVELVVEEPEAPAVETYDEAGSVPLTALLEAQLELRDIRIREMERELAAAAQRVEQAELKLAAELERKASRYTHVPLTEEQRAKNERRRRKELATMTMDRLVQLAMRTDGRLRADLAKLGRPVLVEVIIAGEARTTGRV